VIEEENQNQTNTPDGGLSWENKQAMALRESEEGVIMCKLFENLLQFYELDYTLNVFVHEVNTAAVTEGDALC
jgi:hypothetical protein